MCYPVLQCFVPHVHALLSLNYCVVLILKIGNLQDQLKTSQSSWWFFLPSYDVGHLLRKHENLSSQKDDHTAFSDFKSSASESVEDKWKFANQHYFKSLASVRQLQQTSVNFHKDFTPDQVDFIQH